MIAKYLAPLAIVVVLVTCGASWLQFATRSQVLSGTAVDENLQLEFTIDADNRNTYIVTPALAQFLSESIRFHTDGPARIIASKVEVTPKDVSWTENRENITSKGAAMKASLRWDTPADAANGSHSNIFIEFPEIPGLAGKQPTFHSGGYQKDDAGRYVVREVTTYQSKALLSLERIIFALAAGLPFGIVLHAIWWGFVLKTEKRSLVGAFPPQGTALPRTFYPDPIAEWTIGLIIFGVGAVVVSLMAGFSVYEGFMSSSGMSIIYTILAIALGIALVAAYFTGRKLLTVRVESSGFAYARGCGDLEWINVAWSEILSMMQLSRTYRGNTTYWVEIEFNDSRKKLKIDQTIQGYPALRDLLGSVFHH
jgi:hypothetical protein